MCRYLKKILIISILFICNQALGYNSSAYLIANTAIKLYDFDEASLQFDFSNDHLGEADLFNKLLTLVNVNSLSKAKQIAQRIIKINQFNQEAWAVNLVDSLLGNNKMAFIEFQKIKDNPEMELLNFIFFLDDKALENKKIIAKSILKIVQMTASESQDKVSYEFLLFYLSLANFLDPDFDDIYFYSGKIYDTLKNYSKAEYFYNKVKSSNGLFVESQINISIINRKRGLFDEAEKKLIKLISEFDSDINFKLTLANLYRIEKKYLKAIKYYTNLIQSQNNLSNDYWRLFYLRGICFERLKKWKLAESDFLNSLEIKPDSPQVLNYLAYGWLERDLNIDQSMKMLIKAYKANPNSYYILDSLAWAYFKKNQLYKASELMEKVIIMAPGEAVSLDHLADIYFAMSRKREAIFFWKQALDLSEANDIIIEKIKKKLEIENAI